MSLSSQQWFWFLAMVVLCKLYHMPYWSKQIFIKKQHLSPQLYATFGNCVHIMEINITLLEIINRWCRIFSETPIQSCWIETYDAELIGRTDLESTRAYETLLNRHLRTEEQPPMDQILRRSLPKKTANGCKFSCRITSLFTLSTHKNAN